MTTINWNCKTVDVYPANGENQNVVYNVHWVVTGVSDQLDENGSPYTGRAIGTEQLDTSEITDFVPFESLTNEMVLSWVQSSMGTEKVSELEQNVESQINLLINPTSVTLKIG